MEGRVVAIAVREGRRAKPVSSQTNKPTPGPLMSPQSSTSLCATGTVAGFLISLEDSVVPCAGVGQPVMCVASQVEC